MDAALPSFSTNIDNIVRTNAAREVLRVRFGLDEFREPQAEIIAHVASGGDALVLMPTGGGKSLTYQIPAIMRPGTGIVISPLIALMDDQVRALKRRGIRAGALHAACSPEDIAETRSALEAGSLELLYVSPERVTSPGFMQLLQGLRISLFAIDEAHCISRWGPDFRPDYAGLECLGQRFPHVPRIAVTATADMATRADIARALALAEGRVFVGGFDRPNISIRLEPTESANKRLDQLFRPSRMGPGANIIYCRSRKTVDSVAARLAKAGLPVSAYHAGMDQGARSLAQARFVTAPDITMVATIAFGMGIDRADVRRVVHFGLPDSPEAWYQEAGRAGRDGKPAVALTLWGLGDALVLAGRHAAAQAAGDLVTATRIAAMCDFVRAQEGCRRARLLAGFGEIMREACGNCDACQAGNAAADLSSDMQLLLSAIYRTGQYFGARHLIDVLMGRANEMATSRGHHRLALFGQGATKSRDFWQALLREAALLRLIVPRENQPRCIMLGPAARAVLKGETPVCAAL